MVMRRDDDDDDNITAISSIAIAPISSSFAAASSSCSVLYKQHRQGPELWGGTRCCGESDEISVNHKRRLNLIND
jgi:hypothetical protein